MYPGAAIPTVQLSLMASLNPQAHIALGQALAQLPHKNLLVLGSGFSFHNLPAFFGHQSARDQDSNAFFEQWLHTTLMSDALSETERTDRLNHWDQALGARYCHPREEHLLPLHVCYGVAGGACRARYEAQVMGKLCSFYVW